MGPPTKKRKLQAPGTATSGPSAKRAKNQKTGPPKSKGKGKGKVQQQAKAAAPRRVVDAGALSWETVGEEEFGGLQVIRGVDVVRDGGNVRFAVSDEPAAEAVGAAAAAAVETETQQEDEAESFEGFGDDDVEGATGNSGAGEDGVAVEKEDGAKRKENDGKRKDGKQAEKQQEQQQKKTKKNKTVVEADEELQGLSTGDQNKGNSFSALAYGEAEEEDDGNDGVDVSAWKALKLSPALMAAISKLKFPKPTNIQRKCVPEILRGGDVIGKAQTGSGKTLAFGIPMVERWLELQEDEEEEGAKKKPREGPLAVVLSPTRELAKQLGDHLKALCDGLPSAPYVCVVTGGLSIQKQQRQLEKADIVIGTPGRLWEVLEGDMKLQDGFTKIQFLVVDEADRLLKTGQFKEVEDILGALDKKSLGGQNEEDESEEEEEEEEEDDEEEDDGGARSQRQTLVFSATFDKNLSTKLAGKRQKFSANKEDDSMEYLMKCLKFRKEPKFIDVNPVSQMAEGLKEGLIECGAMEKDLHLYAVMVLNPNRRTLVFTNSISAVRRLTPLLQNLNIAALALHSQMPQKARLRSIERFTASRDAVLVATDVAARGLDIKEVDQVVHYHVPRAADTYIHRSGRTARGDRSGVSIMLCAPDEVIPTRRLAAKVHAQQGRKLTHMIQTLPLNRTILTRLRPRVDLAKKLADAVLAKEKSHGDDAWLRGAAEDLGVEYDPDEFAEAGALAGGGKNGRGGGRRRKEKEASGLTKAEMGMLRAKLREEMSRRVNLGVSEKYITGGRVDVAKLIAERESNSSAGIFLGGEGLGLDL